MAACALVVPSLTWLANVEKFEIDELGSTPFGARSIDRREGRFFFDYSGQDVRLIKHKYLALDFKSD